MIGDVPADDGVRAIGDNDLGNAAIGGMVGVPAGWLAFGGIGQEPADDSAVGDHGNGLAQVRIHDGVDCPTGPLVKFAPRRASPPPACQGCRRFPHGESE